MLEKALSKFEDYISKFDKNEKEILLKYNHSFEVMNLMGEAAFRLDMDKEQIELARLIGLLHDIGRFEQWQDFHSFDDKNIDHADYAVSYLFDNNHIRDFIDDEKYDSIIRKAILNHNKYEIIDAGKCSNQELLFIKMIRDMDKIDIYRVCSSNYEYVFKASEVSSEVLNCFKERKLVSHEMKKSKSDAILMMLAFIFDFNFDCSYDILVSTDNFDLFLSVVEVSDDSNKLWNKIKEICFDKINQGVDNNE